MSGDIIASLYGSNNAAGIRGVHQAAEKIASEFGEEGLEVFEQWLGEVPADAIFDMEDDGQKVAEELDEEMQEKIAEADFLGTVMFHAFQREAARHDKIASLVEEGVLDAFAADVEIEDEA